MGYEDRTRSIIEVSVSPSLQGELLRGLGFDESDYQLALIKPAELDWYLDDDRTSREITFRPVVPDQTVELEFELEPLDSEKQMINKSLRFDLKNVKIFIEREGDDMSSITVAPKELELATPPEVTFFVS